MIVMDRVEGIGFAEGGSTVMDSRLKGVVAATAGVVGVVAQGLSALAQDIASAGNGGTADAAANGGAVATGDVNAGGNAGSAIGVGDSSGAVAVDGGTVSSSTSLSISADGGTAIADASGGDSNFAFVS